MPVSRRRRRPTFLQLESADVVHSFWIPQLNGKTDVIPNRVNTMWIEPTRRRDSTWASAPSTAAPSTRTCCCASSRTSRRTFEPGWRRSARRRRPPRRRPPGATLFQSVACINCHRVGGTVADGVFGPDLTHLMSRATIGAGAAPNTADACAPG